MKIRRLRPGEVRQAVRLVRSNWGSRYDRLARTDVRAAFANPCWPPEYYVIESKGKIVGMAGLGVSWMDYNVYTLFWINVAPERQGQGVGTALVRKLLAVLRAKRKPRRPRLVLLSTSKPGFYERFGFRTLLRIKPADHLMALRL